MLASGEITEVVGERSAGRTSLLVRFLAEVTAAGGIAALIDTDDVFDVAGAARAGVELRRLLWVRCDHRRAAGLRAVDALARCRGFALVAWDVGDVAPRLGLAAAFRVKLAARQGRAAVLIVSPRRIAGAAAALALEARREDTHWDGAPPLARRLAGTRTSVQTVRTRGRKTADEAWHLRAGDE
jgi:hypothetical protein